MTPLISTLTERVLPAAANAETMRLLLVSPNMRQAEMPKGVTLSRAQLKGAGEVSKGDRPYGNFGEFSRVWKSDALVAHNYHKIAVITSGRCDFHTDRYVIHCDAGCILLLPAGTPHPDGETPHLDSPRSDGDGCDIVWIMPRARAIQCWICHSRGTRHWGQGPGDYGFIPNHKAGQLLDMLMDEALVNGAEPRVCSTLIRAIFLILLRDLEQGNSLLHPTLGLGPEVPRDEEDAIQRAQHYVRTHLQNHNTLESVARRVFMSRTRFSQRFKQETGQTFVEFLTHCRLEESQLLLRESQWSVGRIAKYSGFKSVSYFTKLFTREIGMTPERYRREMRADGPGKEVLEEVS